MAIFFILVGMLVPSPKYNVTEISLNPYRYVSVLRMTSLQPDDFDEYKCVSKNTIGKSEAVIDVFSMQLPMSFKSIFKLNLNNIITN